MDSSTGTIMAKANAFIDLTSRLSIEFESKTFNVYSGQVCHNLFGFIGVKLLISNWTANSDWSGGV